MALIRGYMAMSLDGYIADVSGGIGFLARYEGIDYRFNGFFHTIGTCIFGRKTYDQAVTMFGGEWPFADKRVIVVTGQPLETPFDVEIWDRGVGPELVSHLRAATNGEVWVVGGARLLSAFFEMDAIDRMEARIIPVLLGDGVPMFPKAAPRERWLKLADVRAFTQGGVILDYRRQTAA